MTSNEMPLIRHLGELRRRALVSCVAWFIGTVIALFVYQPVIQFIFEPLKLLGKTHGELVFINTLFEGFFTQLKVSMYFGFVLSLPIHIVNALQFMFPAFKRREKVMIVLALTVGLGLACIGMYFGYTRLLPVSIGFLTSHQFIPDNVGVLLNYNQNVFYILHFIIGIAVAFQFPIVLECLLFLGFVSRQTLWSATRYVIVLIFCLSALLTPPDVISQLGLAIPLIVMYFMSILVAKLFGFGESH